MGRSQVSAPAGRMILGWFWLGRAVCIPKSQNREMGHPATPENIDSSSFS
jgi:hypothetical protein